MLELPVVKLNLILYTYPFILCHVFLFPSVNIPLLCRATLHKKLPVFLI